MDIAETEFQSVRALALPMMQTAMDLALLTGLRPSYFKGTLVTVAYFYEQAIYSSMILNAARTVSVVGQRALPVTDQLPHLEAETGDLLIGIHPLRLPLP
jgi:hypothetical protein